MDTPEINEKDVSDKRIFQEQGETKFRDKDFEKAQEEWERSLNAERGTCVEVWERKKKSVEYHQMLDALAQARDGKGGGDVSVAVKAGAHPVEESLVANDEGLHHDWSKRETRLLKIVTPTSDPKDLRSKKTVRLSNSCVVLHVVLVRQRERAVQVLEGAKPHRALTYGFTPRRSTSSVIALMRETRNDRM